MGIKTHDRTIHLLIIIEKGSSSICRMTVGIFPYPVFTGIKQPTTQFILVLGLFTDSVVIYVNTNNCRKQFFSFVTAIRLYHLLVLYKTTKNSSEFWFPSKHQGL